ncbi:hypothetical protein O0I10_009711 [Lichtheimia ornata]|uniref:Uncharacterized protein n=1 Tax=Lichtheimia ornata TaxID=688661 RepID=A0AAD7UY67_9FUNG|nr:uncharacterized protein O0I10_009711 [Lichtheimia ornata]KAJ8654660.1 hypothetical protein O0I10_009711 [Lichtheimia ornata]
MHIRFVSITLAAVLALSSVSVQAAPTPVHQGLQVLGKAVDSYERSFVTFEKRHHGGKDGEDAHDEDDEEEADEDEKEADEEEEEEDERHRHHARSDQSLALTNGEGDQSKVNGVQPKARDVVKRHGHGENEADEDEPEENENEPDEDEPDEDENEPDEDEPDEDENEPDEEEPDEDEDERRHHRHGHHSI